jgi:DNA primase
MLPSYKFIDTGRSPSEKRVCCPMCKINIGKVDKNFHLSINLKSKLYFCYRCGAKGQYKTLEDLLGFNTEYDDSSLNSLEAIKTRLSGKPVETIQEEIKMENFTTIPNRIEHPFFVSYLESRGHFFNELREKYDIRAGKEYVKNSRLNKIWVGRIVFPIKRDNKVVFAVGRSYLGREPKYLNTEGSKSRVLFNMENLGNTIILCEGIFSAITAEKLTGIKAVAPLGKTVANEQLAYLRRWVDNLIVSLDGDVTFKVLNNVVMEALDLGFRVNVVILPNDKLRKDPDDLKEEYLDYFKNMVEVKEKYNLWKLKELYKNR